MCYFLLLYTVSQQMFYEGIFFSKKLYSGQRSLMLPIRFMGGFSLSPHQEGSPLAKAKYALGLVLVGAAKDCCVWILAIKGKQMGLWKALHVKQRMLFRWPFPPHFVFWTTHLTASVPG